MNSETAALAVSEFMLHPMDLIPSADSSCLRKYRMYGNGEANVFL